MISNQMIKILLWPNASWEMGVPKLYINLVKKSSEILFSKTMMRFKLKGYPFAKNKTL